MIIGLAGVTSTGKTTLATAIKEEFGDRVQILEKISRLEIYQYIGHPELNPDLKACTNDEKVMFDVGRCMLQMKKEQDLFKSSVPTIVDGCAIVKAAYMIYLSGQYMEPKTLDDMVRYILDHCIKYYKSIFFLPVTRMPFTAADHRYFSAEWVRKAQDAILWRLLFREIGEKVPQEIFNTLNNNLIFDQLRKMGV